MNTPSTPPRQEAGDRVMAGFWECPECRCQSFARIWQSSDIRCVNCKRVWSSGDATPTVAEAPDGDSLPDRRALASLKGDAQSKAEPSEIEAAVLAEREACAKVATETNRDAWHTRNDEIARRIRARSNPKGGDAPSRNADLNQPGQKSPPAAYSPAPQADPASSCGAARTDCRCDYPIPGFRGDQSKCDRCGYVIPKSCGAVPDAAVEAGRAADVSYISKDEMRKRLEAALPFLVSPAPVGEPIAWYIPHEPRPLDTTADSGVAASWRLQGCDVRPLYAAPHMPSLARAIGDLQYDEELWVLKRDQFGKTHGVRQIPVDALRKANEGAGR